MQPIASDHSLHHSRSQRSVIPVLNNTIEVVNVVKDLVPVDIAKGVLSTVARICTIVRVSCTLSQASVL
jgi:hypothetical protein